jgi:elongation factor G
MKAVYYSDKDKGVTYHEEEIPADKLDSAKTWRANLVEKSAEQDDALLEKFLANGDLANEEIVGIIRKATIARRVVPVYCGSGFKNKGIQRLLDGIVAFLPSPVDLPPIIHAKDESMQRKADDAEPFSGLAFKLMSDKHMGKLCYIRIYSGTLNQGEVVLNSTRDKEQRIGRLIRMHANRQETIDSAYAGDIVAVVGMGDTRTGDTICTRDAKPILLESIEFPTPVMSISVKPANRGESEKMGAALRALADEDPTFLVSFDPETSETILSGMGELHLEVLVERMKREFSVIGEVGRPEVAYRETATASTEGSYKHIKQTGGRGQYAHVVMRLEPVGPGKGFSFVNEVKGGNIPANFIPSVEKGVIHAMTRGPFAGYPVVDMQVTLLDGSYHDVDSSDFAFQEAGRASFKELFLKGNPELLEPVMGVEVTCPEDYMGPVTGSVCSRRGRIDSMETKGGDKVIRGFVPLNDMFGYSNSVRSLTQGRGGFTMQFERYEAVPFGIAEEIIKKRREANKIR